MLEMVLSMGFCGVFFGGVAILYAIFIGVIAPFMYIVYKKTGGKENFIPWFREWSKHW